MLPENPDFHAFIEPARARSAWWRVLLGLVIVAAIWAGWSIAVMGLVAAGWLVPFAVGPEAVMPVSATGRTMRPEGVVFFLLTFLGLWLGLWIVVRALHRRPFGTLLHPLRRPEARNVLGGVALALAFYAVGMVAYFAVLGPPERTGMPLSLWGVWLVPILFLIMMQATSEELLFRGYILQQFAVWSRHPLVWAVVPSLIFAVLHYDPGMEAGMRWRMLVQIFVVGLVMAALVWRTGGLGAAIGLHVANNCLAICGVGISGAAFGFELWLFPADTLERMFVFDLALGLAMLAGIVFFRRRGS